MEQCAVPWTWMFLESFEVIYNGHLQGEAEGPVVDQGYAVRLSLEVSP